jgi:hypothetical protein
MSTPNGYYIWQPETPDSPLGPFTPSDLKAKLKAGEIEPDALVATPGSANWKPVAGVVLAVEAPPVSTRKLPDMPDPPLAPPKPVFRSEPTPVKKPMGCGAWLGAAFLLVVIVVLFLVITGALVENGVIKTPTDEDSLASRAVERAKRDIEARYPGAKSFGEATYHRDGTSPNPRIGDVFTVHIVVDGLNAFGGPVRNRVGVDERWLGGADWKCEATAVEK